MIILDTTTGLDRSVTEQKPVVDTQGLIALAHGREIKDRRALLDGIAALCETSPPGTPMPDDLAEIFLVIARQAETDIRRHLSKTLATAPWAPLAMVNMLALDEIDIARPVILGSPVLADQDLMRLLIEATLEHQIAVAQRPELSETVCTAVMDIDDPTVLTALASNRTARIGSVNMHRLVDRSRHVAGLRAPLIRNPSITQAMAEEMYAWVGQALREAICSQFRVDEKALNTAMESAIQAAIPTRDKHRPNFTKGSPEQVQMEQRLIKKLMDAGQLRPGFLIRAVRERRLGLFIQALADLLDIDRRQIERSIECSSAKALKLACMAVGIDRAVFPGLLVDIRRLSGGYPSPEGDAELASVTTVPDQAKAEFRVWVQGWNGDGV